MINNPNKAAVVRITAAKNKNGKLGNEEKAVLECSDEIYNHIRNPFFQFMYEHIKILRGENENVEDLNEKSELWSRLL